MLGAPQRRGFNSERWWRFPDLAKNAENAKAVPDGPDWIIARYVWRNFQMVCHRLKRLFLTPTPRHMIVAVGATFDEFRSRTMRHFLSVFFARQK
jgi:hypothetical protein